MNDAAAIKEAGNSGDLQEDWSGSIEFRFEVQSVESLPLRGRPSQSQKTALLKIATLPDGDPQPMTGRCLGTMAQSPGFTLGQI